MERTSAARSEPQRPPAEAKSPPLFVERRAQRRPAPSVPGHDAAGRRLPAWIGPLACLTLTGLAFLLAGPVTAGVSGLFAGAVYAADLARMGRRTKRLERLAHTDYLTCLANSRALWRDLTELLERQPVALVLADLDRFKEVNDEYGHAAGDSVLRAFGGLVSGLVAAGARWYRYGGEEFVLVIPDADEDRAAQDAERVRRRVEDGLGAGHPLLTVSAGVAAAAPGCPAHRLLDRADGALRHAKASGRNRVVRASVLGEQAAAAATAAARRAAVTMAAAALEARDADTAEHSGDVVVLCDALAERLGIEDEEREHLRVAASLHDIGKVAVPHHILNKPGPLDDDEWEVMRRHTITGEQIVRSVPELEPVAPLVRSAHERYDGLGYPDGLAGVAIPLGSRVILCADAYHAMRSDRPYRAGRPTEEVIAEITANAGTQFDPLVARTLADVVREANRPGGPRRRILRSSPRLMALLACAAIGGTAVAAVPEIRQEIGKLISSDRPAWTAPTELTRTISRCESAAAQGRPCAVTPAPSAPPAQTGTRERRQGASPSAKRPRRHRRGAAAGGPLVGEGSAGTRPAAATGVLDGTAPSQATAPSSSSEPEAVTLAPAAGGPEREAQAPSSPIQETPVTGPDFPVTETESAPDRPEGTPGHSGESPGRSGESPGRSGESPGQSHESPGRSGENPGHGGESPGQSGSAPGQSGAAPGPSGEGPGSSADAPGHSGDGPGNSGSPPGHSGENPGQGNGTPPGQGGSKPGQGKGNSDDG